MIDAPRSRYVNEPITHDYPNPFVQRQRYTTIEKLRSAKTTDDLL